MTTQRFMLNRSRKLPTIKQENLLGQFCKNLTRANCKMRYFYAKQHPDGYYKTFRVVEGDEIRVEFQYEDARGSIALRVLDQDSVPQSGFVVELYTASGTQERTTLSESGSVLFSELTPADYGVRVLGSGVCPLFPKGFVYRDGLIVSLRQNFEIEIVLPPCFT